MDNLSIFYALDALYSPLYAHLFLGMNVHSDEDIDRHCDLVFPSIFKTPPG